MHTRSVVRIGIHAFLAFGLNIAAQKLFGLTSIEVFAIYFVILSAKYLDMINNFSLAYILQPDMVEKNLKNWRNSIINKEDQQ